MSDEALTVTFVIGIWIAMMVLANMQPDPVPAEVTCPPGYKLVSFGPAHAVNERPRGEDTELTFWYTCEVGDE